MAKELALAGVSLALYSIIDRNNRSTKKKRPRTKRWWVRSLFREGNKCASDLLDSLNMEDGMGFRIFFRMSSTDFEIILDKIGGKISKINTNFRKSISPANRLAATLRFLASGDSYASHVHLKK